MQKAVTKISFLLFMCLTLPLYTFAQAGSMVTVNVDMAGYAGDFGVVYIAGAFNGWSDVANPLADEDGDGVWTGSVMMPDGANEYKFQVDGWTDQEMLTPDSECTLTTNEFTNRLVQVAGSDVVVETVCWNSCSTCEDSNEGMVTVSVDMAGYSGSFDTVYIAGAFNGWSDVANPLADEDGDGIWTGTVLMPAGANEYKFQVDGWADQEMLTEGSSCTLTTSSFTNRLVQVDGDITIAPVCWNSCTACGEEVGGMITFSVDMNRYEGDFNTVYISGEFNGWSGGSNPLADEDGDGVWTGTVMMPAGANEYKFQLDEFLVQEVFAGGEACTITDDSGQFTNRLISVNGDAIVGTVCFNACTDCSALAVLPTLPITFETEGEDYVTNGFGASDFGALPAMVIDNPDASGANTSAKVLSFEKQEGAQVFAGVAIPVGSIIDLGDGQFSMQVWSPRADVPVLLKFEDTDSAPDGNGNPSVIAELIINTTVANTWETIMYDMTTATGYDAANEYDQIVVFPDFGSMGVAGGEIFYIDNIQRAKSNSIKETLDANVGLTIFPNPASEVVQISLELPTARQTALRLTDAVGKTVQQMTLGNLVAGTHQKSVPLHQLPVGTYFLLLEVDQQVVQFETLVIK